MAKIRYRVKVCDGEACKEIGKAKGTLEQAKKALHKEMSRKGKRKFKRLPGGDIRGNAIHGEVWESQRGKIVGEAPVYVGVETYGEPGPVRRPARRPRPRTSED